MLRIKRIALVVTALIILSVLGVIFSAVLSLDWDYEHASRTADLPLISDSVTDGLTRINTDEFEFRSRIAGLDNTGPGLILLHGFPETSAMWAPLINAAGLLEFRVVAFDQRGYSPGARPKGIDSYNVDALMEDIISIANRVGFEQFHLVGHDWGAVVGWGFAAKYPERLLSWTALSIPHPDVLLEDIVTDTPDYIRFFQTPWLPELTFSFNGMKKAKQFFGQYPDNQQKEYTAVFSEPGALTATLNWYRAIKGTYEIIKTNPSIIKVPVLFIWGKHDFYAQWADTKKHQALVDNDYQELELDTGHFLMQTDEKRVIEAIINHIQDTVGI